MEKPLQVLAFRESFFFLRHLGFEKVPVWNFSLSDDLQISCLITAVQTTVFRMFTVLFLKFC